MSIRDVVDDCAGDGAGREAADPGGDEDEDSRKGIDADRSSSVESCVLRVLRGPCPDTFTFRRALSSASAYRQSSQPHGHSSPEPVH